MVRCVFSVLLCLICCTSCNSSFEKKEEKQYKLDTIIDFSKVDVPPTFENCEEKHNLQNSKCFEQTIHQNFTEHFSKLTFTHVEKQSYKAITIIIKFDKKGKTSLKKINCLSSFLKKNRTFVIEVNEAINKLPSFYPATKQSIPVTTLYKLPVKIN